MVAEAAGHTTELALPEVRALLADRLRGRPTRANFRTGHLTICTLVPMRSVPHRVVCLLGLDDGVFPRKAPRDGDDLMLDDPHVGERDARTEDRQQLLDALMAATERLIVTYTGNDERTNLARPPAVPVGELLDVVGRAVVVRHPLQPFDARNFEVGEVVPDRVWSFDHVTLNGARALAGERSVPGPFLTGPLPRAGDDAGRARRPGALRASGPCGRSCASGSGIAVGDYSDEIDDALSVELDGLELWRVGQRLLDARLAGAEPRATVLAEIARGTLPPGVLGRPVIERVQPVVEEIVAHVPEGDAGSVDVKVALPDGRTLSGTVPGVGGDVIRTVNYARVSARHRLAAWVRLLALTAAHPERPFEAVTVGRAPSGSDARVTIARIPALDPDPAARRALALDHLAVLLDLYDRGMREPPPLSCNASAAYAAAARAGGDPVAAGRGAWESAYTFDREDRDPEHQLVLGGVLTFAELFARAGACGRVGPVVGRERDAALRPLGAAAVGRAARDRGRGRPVTRPFDIRDPLPVGVTVLEASAGTGKTYTIAALAARYVAEGTPLHELLLVTFTRMATGELRERVRERLVSAEQALSGGASDERDEVVRLLSEGTPERGAAPARPPRARARRLRRGDDRHHARVLPGGARRARRGRERRARQRVRRGRDRSGRRGRGRPLRPSLLPRRRGGRVQPRGGGADRVDRGGEPRRADRAARPPPRPPCRRCAGGSRSRSATSSSAASSAPA